MLTLVLQDGKVAHFKSYGYRDLENKLPMERDTLCRIYSMSKIVTSVGVLVLMEEGRFHLQDALTNYVPELRGWKVMTGGTVDSPQLEPLKRAVTIKHLLTHTSGLVYDFAGTNPIQRLYQKADLWNSSNLVHFAGKVDPCRISPAMPLPTASIPMCSVFLSNGFRP